ncbi:hypothetical protein [Kitasatospora sp. NPDC002965]|uniref:hypothetical protein n=1 Tax=Kitasatospora sp. NPDC002965 TaxID=3154775 RepID=UPI0033A821E6
MAMKKLGRTAAAAAALAATTTGMVVGPAGTASAASADQIMLRQCLKSTASVEYPFHEGSDLLCGGGFGRVIPVYNFDDGTRQIFFVGPERGVWTTWTNPNGSFGGRVWLGGQVTSDIDFAGYHGNFLQLKARGTDGATWYNTRYEDGHWGGWFR